MQCFVGIDLGSTTTKAVVMDEGAAVLGRGITNSRSNYDTAAAVSKREAFVDARFTLVRRGLDTVPALAGNVDTFLADLERHFRHVQFLRQLDDLEATCASNSGGPRFAGHEQGLAAALAEVFRQLRQQSAALFTRGARRKSDFFRDIAGSQFMAAAEPVCRAAGLSFDLMLNLYDKSIIEVENRPPSDAMETSFAEALDRTLAESTTAIPADTVRGPVRTALAVPLDESYVVGTGYGRVRLPFPKEHIRSEILCHGLGAHIMFDGTRTVLDIGGQDTKVISLGPRGKVLDFEMNDKCAAGTGKFLEVMAGALGFELDELGPAALDVSSGVRISSMCTVFAESEVTGLVHRGEDLRRIALGLHDAIASRTLATLARVCPSGPLVFAGGVARNPAMACLIADGFDGEVLVPEECQTVGALGAALWARADSHAR